MQTFLGNLHLTQNAYSGKTAPYVPVHKVYIRMIFKIGYIDILSNNHPIFFLQIILQYLMWVLLSIPMFRSPYTYSTTVQHPSHTALLLFCYRFLLFKISWRLKYFDECGFAHSSTPKEQNPGNGRSPKRVKVLDSPVGENEVLLGRFFACALPPQLSTWASFG